MGAARPEALCHLISDEAAKAGEKRDREVPAYMYRTSGGQKVARCSQNKPPEGPCILARKVTTLA